MSQYSLLLSGTTHFLPAAYFDPAFPVLMFSLSWSYSVVVSHSPRRTRFHNASIAELIKWHYLLLSLNVIFSLWHSPIHMMHTQPYTYDVDTALYIWCRHSPIHIMHTQTYTYDAHTALYIWCTHRPIHMMHTQTYTYDAHTALYIWCTHRPIHMM